MFTCLAADPIFLAITVSNYFFHINHMTWQVLDFHLKKNQQNRYRSKINICKANANYLCMVIQ